jgi:hypothetical protein
MEHLKGLTRLENVWINGNPITNHGLACLAGMRGLKELYANATKVTDDGLVVLEGMGSFHHLFIGGIGDKGLATLGKLPAIDFLQVQNARVTRAGIPSLQKMRAMKRLLISGDDVDDSFLAEIKAALPKCEVKDPQAQWRGVPRNPQWKKKFDKVYRLEAGENLKRIPPPFIPERQDYNRVMDPGQEQREPEGPNMMYLQWDGRLHIGTQSFGSGFDLHWILKYAMGLERYEYEGPDELLNIPDVSDWITRTGVDSSVLLKELEKILAGQLGQRIKFEKRRLQRDAIVIRGQYRLHPEQGVSDRDGVYIYVDALTKNDGAGGGSGTFGEFFRWVGDRVGVRVINESQTGESMPMAWRNCQDSDRKQIADHPAKLERLLKNLARQTTLEFKIERRPVDVWFVTRQ